MIILIIGTIIVSIVTLTGQSLVEGGRAQLISDVQEALDRIDSDVQISGAYLSTNNFTPTSPQGLDDATTKFASKTVTGFDALVLNSFFTTANPATSTRSLVYLPNAPFACGDANIAQNQVLTYNTVYFVKDSSLWRRIITTANYASKPCSGVTVWQQPSCAESKMSANPTLCKTQDEMLLSGVAPADFTVKYYVSPSDTTPNADADNGNPDIRQDAIDKSATIQVTLKGSKSIAGRDISQQATIRITRTGSVVKYFTPTP